MEDNNENNVEHTVENKVRRKNFLVQMLAFIWSKKVYWIVPVILFLILLIFLIAVGTSPVSPFIYTII
jgi:hypothetical protein